MLKTLFGTSISADDVIQQWQTLIPGAYDKGDFLYQDIANEIHATAIPGIKMEYRMVRPGDAGVRQNKQKFLVIENERLNNYDIFIIARGYGNQLIVSWYVVREKPGLKQSLGRKPIHTLIFLPFILAINVLSLVVSVASRFSPSFGQGAEMAGGVHPLGFVDNLNLSDQQELSAYVSTVQTAVNVSTKKLSQRMNLDFAKIDARSRGFLNIS